MREAVERALVAYDWAENLVGINLVLRPAVDEGLLAGAPNGLDQTEVVAAADTAGDRAVQASEALALAPAA